MSKRGTQNTCKGLRATCHKHEKKSKQLKLHKRPASHGQVQGAGCARARVLWAPALARVGPGQPDSPSLLLGCICAEACGPKISPAGCCVARAGSSLPARAPHTHSQPGLPPRAAPAPGLALSSYRLALAITPTATSPSDRRMIASHSQTVPTQLPRFPSHTLCEAKIRNLSEPRCRLLGVIEVS